MVICCFSSDVWLPFVATVGLPACLAAARDSLSVYETPERFRGLVNLRWIRECQQNPRRCGGAQCKVSPRDELSLQTARTNGLAMLASSLCQKLVLRVCSVSLRLLLQTFWQRAWLGVAGSRSRRRRASELGHISRLIATDRAGKDVSCVTPQREKESLWSEEKKRKKNDRGWGWEEEGGGCSLSRLLPPPAHPPPRRINKRSGRRGGGDGEAATTGKMKWSISFYWSTCLLGRVRGGWGGGWGVVLQPVTALWGKTQHAATQHLGSCRTSRWKETEGWGASS